MVKTEAILNSRPMMIAADNEIRLTANYFLISTPLDSLPPQKFDSQIPDRFVEKCAENDQSLLETTRQAASADNVKGGQMEQ